MLQYKLASCGGHSFTCKRSESGIAECCRRMEVSNSLLVLVTVALLALPFPALFAMTCSDRRRSCDSSGMSRRRKTTSKRERRAEPILQTKSKNKLNIIIIRLYPPSGAARHIELTLDFQTQSCLCCNVLRWGLQLLRRMFWQAERKLCQP